MPLRDRVQAVDRSSPLPLWAQMQEDLRRRLTTGAFAERFPTELELVEQYAVSRHTVREALRRLRDSGVLDSARGRGTWIAQQQPIEQPLGSLYSLFQEAEERGMRQRSDVLALRAERNSEAAIKLGLPDDAELVYLERLRWADDEPLAHDQIWLPADLGAPVLDADFTHSGLYDELASRCGVRLTGGRERITAVVPDKAIRILLAVPRAVACLLIERTGCLHRRPIEWRTATVRGDRFAVLSDWGPCGKTLRADRPVDLPSQ
ncbi:MAG: GntR family transcriptional regulator [Pseudonocardiaceae bacterium]